MRQISESLKETTKCTPESQNGVILNLHHFPPLGICYLLYGIGNSW